MDILARQTMALAFKACQTFNPTNPRAVAVALPQVFDALQHVDLWLDPEMDRMLSEAELYQIVHAALQAMQVKEYPSGP